MDPRPADPALDVLEAVREVGVVTQDPHHREHAPPGVGTGQAGFHDDQLGDRIDVGCELLGEAQQDRRSLLHRQAGPGPRVERGPGRVDGSGHVLLGGCGGTPEGLFGRGVDKREVLAPGGRPPCVVDEQLALQDRRDERRMVSGHGRSPD